MAKTISVMRLGELLGVTKRAKRRALVKEIIKKPDSFRWRYKAALDAIYIGLQDIDNEDDRQDFFADEIAKIETEMAQVEGDSPEYNRLAANIKVIEIVQNNHAFRLNAVEKLPKRTYKRLYENFAVTLTPDFVFRTKKGVAAIKIRISQQLLSSEHRKVITAMLVCNLQNFFPEEKIDYNNCWLFDLYSESCVKTTKDNKRALSDLDEICCEEIAPQINRKLEKVG